MMPTSWDSFDTQVSWSQRLLDWLNDGGRAQQSPFIEANRLAIAGCLKHQESGLRMVVNISGDALLEFVRSGSYGNIYSNPVIAGKRRTPSETRKHVDTLLGFSNPGNIFYGAAAMGGTGVRFYGEYCMVLKPDRVSGTTQVFDRNSYDLVVPPLSSEPDLGAVAKNRQGRWTADIVDMLVLKVLPPLAQSTRLITLGSVSDAILHDEDFLEVHREGTFHPSDLEEIRETPEDQAIHSHIIEDVQDGGLATIEELIWVYRRIRVADSLRSQDVRTRVVSSAGRGSRWD